MANYVTVEVNII